MMTYTEILSTGSARSRCDSSSMETEVGAPAVVVPLPASTLQAHASSRRRRPPAANCGTVCHVVVRYHVDSLVHADPAVSLSSPEADSMLNASWKEC